MNILLAYWSHSAGVDEWYRSIASVAPNGISVTCFSLTIDPPGPRLSWLQLNQLWKQRDAKLLELYERLQAAADRCDVLLNYNGANLHPEFLQHLSTLNIYCCFDDPESSYDLSAPVAAYYDAVFYGNIAARFQYEHWGCRKLAWLPVFTAPGDVPNRTQSGEVLTGKRDIDVSFVGGKSHWRHHRLAALQQAFPAGQFFGRGWDNGYLCDEQMNRLYLRSKIGWNVHNSTGPINRRLFALAAYCVLPLCDNKTGLGQIFRLGAEAIGFDTIPEAIDATEYYLNHDEERQQIAIGAYSRFWRDYHAEALWRRIKKQATAWMAEAEQPENSPIRIIQTTPPIVTGMAVRKLRAAKKQLGRKVNMVIRGVNAARTPNHGTENCRF